MLILSFSPINVDIIQDCIAVIRGVRTDGGEVVRGRVGGCTWPPTRHAGWAAAGDFSPAVSAAHSAPPDPCPPPLSAGPAEPPQFLPLPRLCPRRGAHSPRISSIPAAPERDHIPPPYPAQGSSDAPGCHINKCSPFPGALHQAGCGFRDPCSGNRCGPGWRYCGYAICKIEIPLEALSQPLGVVQPDNLALGAGNVLHPCLRSCLFSDLQHW